MRVEGVSQRLDELPSFSSFLRQLKSGNVVFRMGEQKGFRDVLCWAGLGRPALCPYRGVGGQPCFGAGG